MTDSTLLQTALASILSELTDGPTTGKFVLDSNAVGLIAQLESLSAQRASARPAPQRMSIVAHANHLRYSLHILNRWAGGDENAFTDADWASSWNLQTVTDSQWRDLLAELRREANVWRDAIQKPREWDEMSLAGAVGSVAHVAYHLGAIRQLVLLQSPPA